MAPRKRVQIEFPVNASNGKIKVAKRTSRGGLAQLANMPLDIWFEVLGWLDPVDLLQLARSTTSIRKVLMSCSSAIAWKAARSNIPGLPEPALGMSEPAWANLIFTSRCHVCMTTNVRNIEFVFSVRICARCMDSHVKPVRLIRTSDPKLTNKIATLVPLRPGTKKPYIGEPMCYQGNVDRVVKRYSSFNDEEKKKYRAERRELLLRHTAHIKRSEKWLLEYEKDREKDQRQVKSGRLYSILEKLGDLGYLTEFDQMSDDQMYAFIKHRLVFQNRLLTERIWLNIKDEIISYMEDIRTKRLEREYDKVIRPRKTLLAKVVHEYTTSTSHYPYTQVLPGLADFYTFKPIKEILECPADVVVDADTFSPLIPSLSDLCNEWRSSLDSQLLARLLNPGGIDSTELLSLAQNVLLCSTCNTPQFYPQVLTHRCLTEVSAERSKSDNCAKYDPTLGIKPQFCSYPDRYRQSWSAEGLLLDEQLSKIVKDIIRVLGLDPNTTTAADLDDLKMYFRCLICRSVCANNKRFITADDEDHIFRLFGWRRYVYHLFRMKDRYEPLELDMHVKLMTLEESKGSDYIVLSTEQDTKHWLCLHCRDTDREKRPDARLHMKMHVQKIHKVEAPEVNKDYYQQFAVPPLLPRSIVKITTELV
ncbi:hypothetical protein IW261DRAFT_1490057 [Armillaria novae-zelandiae]|uniref:F-box domain-containing protein n=1 Tax=Armillaria novae-zelandiae TaxID=153914 RepID=A0AA39P4H7_9AGAR|nr:hypothetical protein IW261DRAFT_1490057 [Armillaria novae-zelandiae]